jgi:hypothetical protein
MTRIKTPLPVARLSQKKKRHWTAREKLTVLMYLDSFRGHLVDAVKHRFEEKNTNLAIIPGGLTSKLQPLDVCINKPFKSKVRKVSEFYWNL